MASPLEWLFKLTDRMSAPAKAMSTAVNGVTKATKGADAATKQLEVTDKAAAEGAEKFTGALTAKTVAIGAAVAGTVMLANGVKSLVGEFIDAGAAAERTRLSFDLMLGKPKSKELLDYIDAIKDSTEFTRAQLQGLAAPLAAKGLSPALIKRFLPAALDAGAESPGNALGASGAALEALGRVKIGKTIDTGTLEALNLPILETVKALNAVTGNRTSSRRLDKGLTSPAELLADISERMTRGRVNPNVVLMELLKQRTGKQGDALGGNAVQASQTMDAMLNKLRGLPADILGRVSESPGFAKLTESVGRLIERLSSPEVVASITRLGDALLGALGRVDFAKIVGFLSVLLSGFVAVFGFFADHTEILTLVAIGFGSIAAAVAVVGVAVGAVLASLTAFGYGLAFAWHQIFRFIAFLAEPHVEIVKAGYNLVAGFVKGIWDGIGQIGSAVAAMGTSAVDGLKAALGIKSPSTVFARLGMYTGEGFAVGIARSSDVVDDAMAGAFGVRGGAIAAPSFGGGGIGGGGVHIGTLNVPIQIDGAGMNASEIEGRMREVVPGLLISALDQLAQSQGYTANG